MFTVIIRRFFEDTDIGFSVPSTRTPQRVASLTMTRPRFPLKFSLLRPARTTDDPTANSGSGSDGAASAVVVVPFTAVTEDMKRVQKLAGSVLMKSRTSCVMYSG